MKIETTLNYLFKLNIEKIAILILIIDVDVDIDWYSEAKSHYCKIVKLINIVQ